MIGEYIMGMSMTEKIYLLIVIILVIALVFVIVKFQRYSKELIKKLEDKTKDLENNKPNNIEKITIEEEPNPAKMELERVLEQMRQDLEREKQQKADPIKSFEEEQEEKSIISYQELVRANQKEMNEIKEVKEEIKEKQKEIVNETKKQEELTTTKFRNSEIISPIFGRINTDVEYPTIPKIRRSKLGDDEIENDNIENIETNEEEPTLDIIEDLTPQLEEIKTEVQPIRKLEKNITVNTERLQKELLKNEEFLKTLREFRKKLD